MAEGIQGLAQLTKNMRELPKRFEKVQRVAVKAGGKIIQKEMRKRAKRHRKSGKLHRSIRSIVRVDRKGAVATIGPMRRAFYATFLEYGARKSGRQPASPFARPAWLAKRGKVLQEIADVNAAGLKRMRFGI